LQVFKVLLEETRLARSFNEIINNLISIDQLCDNNYITIFDKYKSSKKHNRKIILSRLHAMVGHILTVHYLLSLKF